MNTKIFYMVQALDSRSTEYEDYMDSESLIEAEEFRDNLLAKRTTHKIEAVKILKVEELDKIILVNSEFV